MRRKIIEALNFGPVSEPLPQAAATVIDGQIAMRRLATFRSSPTSTPWRPVGGRPPGCSAACSETGWKGHLKNLFGLLALRHPPKHIWAAHRSLTTPGSVTRGHALEYLDNTLSGATKQAVFAAIDAQPMADKLRQARAAVRHRSGAALPRCSPAIWHNPCPRTRTPASLTVAALHGICTEKLSSLYPEVKRLAAEAENEFVVETACWAESRIAENEARPE